MPVDIFNKRNHYSTCGIFAGDAFILKHGILGLISNGDKTGYEIMAVFRDSLNHFRTARTSQIYRELQAMEKSGWISRIHVAQAGKPVMIHRLLPNRRKRDESNSA